MRQSCLLVVVTIAALSGVVCTEIPAQGPSPTPAPPPAPVNRNPTTGALEVSSSSSGLSIAGLTEFALGLPDATDADGDQLTFVWDFGDGTVATGRLVRKIYSRGGAYRVEVAVSDGKGGKALANTSLQVADLDGRWSNTDSGGTTRTFEFTHRGTSLTGTYIRSSSATGFLSGSLTPPKWIDVFASIPGDTSISISRAEINADVTAFTGYIMRNGRVDSPQLIWTREKPR
jgi:hypothetical protein